MSRKWTAALFKVFQARYGHKWTSSIDGIERIAVEEWSKGLAGVTPEQVEAGLKAWTSEWPPSLPEFQQACVAKDTRENAAMYREERILKLRAPKSDVETGERGIMAARQALKGWPEL